MCTKMLGSAIISRRCCRAAGSKRSNCKMGALSLRET